MKQLLVIGETILAAGYFFDDADELRVYRDPEMTECDAIYPHHVMEGYGIAEADVPDGFRCADYLWQGEVVARPSPAATQDDKTAKLALVNAECDRRMSALVAGYPEREQQTFDKQEKEARAFTADAAAATPMLDELALNRGIDKPTLASRIIAKADAFAAYSGKMIGYRQKLEDQINAAADMAALGAIDVSSGWPA